MNVAREQVGIGPDCLDRCLTVSLVNPHGATGAHPVGMEENHDLPDNFLLTPRILDLKDRSGIGCCSALSNFHPDEDKRSHNREEAGREAIGLIAIWMTALSSDLAGSEFGEYHP